MAVEPIVGGAGVAVGAVLVGAGLAKLRNPRQFGSQIATYSIVPSSGSRFLGFTLPPYEVFVGLAMIALVPIAALLSAVAFACFAGAIAVNLRRGRSDLICGCFGARGVRRISWSHVMLNVIASAVSITVILIQPPIGFAVVLLAGTMLTAGIVVYLIRTIAVIGREARMVETP